MAEGYVHGIVIKEGSGEVRTIRSPSPHVIGIVGTAASDSTLKALEPQVFFKEKAALAAIFPEGSKSDKKGSLYYGVRGIYAQANATVVMVRSNSESDADIIAAIDKLLEAESLTSYKPKILLAPGFGNTNPTTNNGPVTPPNNDPVTPPNNDPVTPPNNDPVTPPNNDPVTPVEPLEERRRRRNTSMTLEVSNG